MKTYARNARSIILYIYSSSSSFFLYFLHSLSHFLSQLLHLLSYPYHSPYPYLQRPIPPHRFSLFSLLILVANLIFSWFSLSSSTSFSPQKRFFFPHTTTPKLKKKHHSHTHNPSFLFPLFSHLPLFFFTLHYIFFIRFYFLFFPKTHHPSPLSARPPASCCRRATAERLSFLLSHSPISLTFCHFLISPILFYFIFFFHFILIFHSPFPTITIATFSSFQNLKLCKFFLLFSFDFNSNCCWNWACFICGFIFGLWDLGMHIGYLVSLN